MSVGAYTYNDAVEKCKAIGLQLCTSDEMCPDNIPVYGIKVGHDIWTPSSDLYNEWIQIGMYCFIQYTFQLMNTN
jgi:hypothetical protein